MSIINNDLSFYDCNAFIGAHENPYSKTPFEPGLLCEAMNSSGTRGVLVYHSAAVVYDAFYGNKLLVEKIKGINELIPVFVAAPELCFNQKESEKFSLQIKENNIHAVKIFPRTNNFDITSGIIDRLLSFLDKEEILLLSNQIEIKWNEIEYILSKFSSLPFLLQSTGYRMERYLNPLFAKHANFFFDISRYHVHGGIEYLCGEFGSERIFYGSGMPLFSPEPLMIMVDKANISTEAKQNISGKNLLRLLNNE